MAAPILRGRVLGCGCLCRPGATEDGSGVQAEQTVAGSWAAKMES